VLTQALLVYETLRVSAATVVDNVLGRLDRENVDRKMEGWARRCLDRADLTLDVRGADQVDWARAYVIMTNHQSYFDIPVVVVAVPGSVRFIAKKELFRIPVFGPAMKAAGIISIDRQDRERAIESLKRAEDEIHAGINIWIAPEGTRSRDGKLGPLKKGGFVLALETGAPILPAAIDGTRDAMPRGGSLRRGATATVTFGKPIEVQGRGREEIIAETEEFLRAHVG
jgi:1-acyl-sn-glycerol-3-phosphate acyltransferase